MPKNKTGRSPLATPESPRKTPKKHEFSSPRKADPAGNGSASRNGQSPSPVRRPKPKFNLEEEVACVTGESGVQLESSYLDEMPDSPPVFQGLVKLKEKRVKREIVDEKNPEESKVEKLKKPETSKSVEKPKVEKVKKEDDRVKEEPSWEDEKKKVFKEIFSSPSQESPHKIYLRKDKKEKKKEKKEKASKKTKKKTKKISVDDDITYNSGSKITDFFDVRRSSRKPAKQIENERNALWRKLIREECIDGLEVRKVPLKGRGIFNTKTFQKDDFVVEYSGDLIGLKEAEIRDEKYSNNTDKYGSYMYYFVHKGTKWCIDATIESKKLGRLLNHSCKTPNCATRVIEVDNIPRLVIYAKEDISADNELLYDYGDRGKVSLEAHPWLKL